MASSSPNAAARSAVRSRTVVRARARAARRNSRGAARRSAGRRAEAGRAARPSTRLAATGFVHTSAPCTMTVPVSGRSSPVTIEQRRGLPGPVRADDAEDRARRHGEVDPVDRDVSPKRLDRPSDGQHRLRRRPAAPALGVTSGARMPAAESWSGRVRPRWGVAEAVARRGRGVCCGCGAGCSARRGIDSRAAWTRRNGLRGRRCCLSWAARLAASRRFRRTDFAAVDFAARSFWRAAVLAAGVLLPSRLLAAGVRRVDLAAADLARSLWARVAWPRSVRRRPAGFAVVRERTPAWPWAQASRLFWRSLRCGPWRSAAWTSAQPSEAPLSQLSVRRLVPGGSRVFDRARGRRLCRADQLIGLRCFGLGVHRTTVSTSHSLRSGPQPPSRIGHGCGEVPTSFQAAPVQ